MLRGRQPVSSVVVTDLLFGFPEVSAYRIGVDLECVNLVVRAAFPS